MKNAWKKNKLENKNKLMWLYHIEKNRIRENEENQAGAYLLSGVL